MNDEQEIGSQQDISQQEKTFLKRFVSKLKRLPTIKKILFFLSVIALVAIFSIALFITDEKPEKLINTNSQQPNSVVEVNDSGSSIPYVEDSSIADKLVPDFSDIRGYVEQGDDKWYVTSTALISTSTSSKGYSLKTVQDIDSNLTSFTDIVLYKGQVWLGAQGGVVKIDQDSVKTYLHGVANVVVEVDPHTGDLYVGTFKSGIFKYDSETDKFVDPRNTSQFVQSPRRVSQIAFTDKYVVALESNDGIINLLEKDTGNWTTLSPEKFTKDQGRDRSYINLMQVADQIIFYGRHVDYGSCAEDGIVPATVVYQLVGDNVVELTELTEIFSRDEASRYDFSATALSSIGSCNNNEEFYVELSANNGKVIRSEKQVVSNRGSFSGYSFDDRETQLEKELGFPSRLKPQQAIGVTNILGQSLEKYVLFESSTVSPVTGVNEAFTVNNSYPPVTTIVSCAQKTYTIATSSSDAAYNTPYLLSIGMIENGSNNILYETSNTQLYEGVAVEFSVGSHVALCNGNELVLFGETSQYAVFDTTTNEFSVMTLPEHFTSTSLSKAAIDEGRFEFIDIVNDRYAVMNVSSKEVVTIELASSSIGKSPQSFSAWTDGYVTVAGRLSDKNTSYLLTYSLSDGSIVEYSELEKLIHDIQRFDGSSMILQYSDGETKIVDAQTHKSLKTISKPKSIVGERSVFNLIKERGTVFLITDSHVWFYSRNWGLIAYGTAPI